VATYDCVPLEGKTRSVVAPDTGGADQLAGLLHTPLVGATHVCALAQGAAEPTTAQAKRTWRWWRRAAQRFPWGRIGLALMCG
jgi:hypothetical protein